jgi:hypothetical protein
VASQPAELPREVPADKGNAEAIAPTHEQKAELREGEDVERDQEAPAKVLQLRRRPHEHVAGWLGAVGHRQDLAARPPLEDLAHKHGDGTFERVNDDVKEQRSTPGEVPRTIRQRASRDLRLVAVVVLRGCLDVCTEAEALSHSAPP